MIEISGILLEIQQRQWAIGEERDKLDDLISNLKGLKDDCDEAYDALQTARDAMSRLQ